MNREKQTFNNFIVSQANEFAYLVAKKVARESNENFNPLYIYGKMGLGKTFLLKAIENEIKSQCSDLKVVYITTEGFLNELTEAIPEKSMKHFHNKFRNVDVLLIDDFQFISGKHLLQKELFYTFDSLINKEKRIVLASDRPQCDLDIISEDLRSRIISGVIAEIKPPEFETRVEAIKKKSEELEFAISDEVIEYIATRVQNSIRDIEVVVKKLFAIYAISNKNPDKELVDEIIESFFCLVNSNEEIVKRIIKEVSKTFGVSEYDVRANVKNRYVTSARQYAIYIIRELTDMTLDEIGGLFGDKKHSTVLYACETIEEKLEYNPALQKVIDDIIENVTGVPSKIRKNHED